MKKFLTMLTALLMLVSTVLCGVGCGDDSGSGSSNEKVDTQKTQIYLGAYNGGYGDLWMQDLKERFEKKYADTSFEEGKMGVQVISNSNNTTYVGENILNNINNLNSEIVFLQDPNYSSYALTGKVMDITEILKENLNEKLGEDTTVFDKIPAEIQAFMNSEVFGGKYYGIPHLETFYGFNYNVDLFEENLWYLSDNKANGNDGFIKNASEKRSKGPNGVYDYDSANPDKITDDGLPATYEEFYKLCKRISDTNEYVPLTWAGNANQYNDLVMASMWANEGGLENHKRLFDSKGTLTNVVDNKNLSSVKNVELNYANGYEVYRSKDLYDVISFYEKIIKGGWHLATQNFSSSYTNLKAQRDFVLTGHNSNQENKVAMLAEGSYWESEAASAWTALEKYGTNKYEARYAFMPFPKASEDKITEGEKQVFSSGVGWLYLNANVKPEKMKVLTLFLQFLNSNESLAEFTKITGATKCMNYTLSDEQYNALSYWEKSVWDLRTKADRIYEISDSPLYVARPNSFRTYLNLEGGEGVIVNALKDGKTAEQIFNSIGDKMADGWAQTFEAELNKL